MISYLKGEIKLKQDNFLVIETAGGIGYKVFVPPQIILKAKKGEKLELFTHQYIAEGQVDLYGFREMAAVEIFRELIDVSGVGPKTALGVLSKISRQELEETILQEKAEVLTKVSGIGKKTAERIIVDLKSKIEAKHKVKAEKNKEQEAAEEALVNLGYSAQEAKSALGKISQDINQTEEQIKEALKVLGRK
jgi:Holliday junction DNA helicase RuvA